MQLGCAQVFPAPAVFGADRLVVELESKVAHDEICGQLGWSPARHGAWVDVTVRVRLTFH